MIGSLRLGTVNKYTKFHGIKYVQRCIFTKKCSVNENYFKTWTPDNAYIFGLLCADGCVYKHHKSSKYRVSLQSSCLERNYTLNLVSLMESTYKTGIYKGFKHCVCLHTMNSHNECKKDVFLENLINLDGLQQFPHKIQQFFLILFWDILMAMDT